MELKCVVADSIIISGEILKAKINITPLVGSDKIRNKMHNCLMCAPLLTTGIQHYKHRSACSVCKKRFCVGKVISMKKTQMIYS